MRFKSACVVALLSVASLVLNACGGGGSHTAIVLTPVFSNGSTSSNSIPLSPVAPVQATGGAKFSTLSSSTTFPTLSVSLAGNAGTNSSLSTPVFDLTGATMQITYNPGVSTVVSKSYGGTTYVDTYGSGTFDLDAWHVFRELQVTGLTNAYSDYVYYLPVYASDALDYTQYGMWTRDTSSNSANTIFAPYVTGYVTPTGSMPSSGTANYTGRTIGAGALTGTDGGYLIRGDFAATANFTSGTVVTSFTNVIGTNSLSGVSTYFSNFGGTANIAGSSFSGSIASTATLGTILTGSGSLTGSLHGQFYGPTAQEIGGVWALTGGGWNAAGSFGGH